MATAEVFQGNHGGFDFINPLAEEDRHYMDLEIEGWQEELEASRIIDLTASTPETSTEYGDAPDLTDHLVVHALTGRARRQDQLVDSIGGRHSSLGSTLVLGSDYYDS